MSRKLWLAIVLFAVFAASGCDPLNISVPNGDYPPPLLSDGFDFPVGDRHGNGWAVSGYGFLDWSIASNSYHPGEDWNIPGAGNGDWGEPVYAVANGKVVFSGWNSALGNVVLIKHSLSRNEFVWSQYAHLDQRHVATGETVWRRQQLGTVGRGPNNRFSAHLHFELRKKDLSANAWPRTDGQAWAREKILDYWLNPTVFIHQNRPL